MLDLGCGTGFVLAGLRGRFPAISFTGGELFAAGLEVARRRLPGVPLLQLDARRLPFTNAFDVVGAFDVLEHVDDDERVLAEMYRATRPGGGAIVTVPQHPWLWSVVDELSEHRRRYTRDELVSKLERARFVVLHHTSFVTLLLPLLALSRLRSVRVADYDPTTEYRMPRLVGRALGAIMAMERRLLLERGLGLRAGGSLLAVARKPE